MTDPVPPGPLDPAVVQARIAGARAQLLGGRGTGASRAEIDRRTRARPRLGGEPTPQHLATVAGQTAIARGDAAAIALDIAATRSQLATTVQAIRGRVRPSRIAGRQARAVRKATATGWAAITVTVAVLVLVRRHAHRVSPIGRGAAHPSHRPTPRR